MPDYLKAAAAFRAKAAATNFPEEAKILIAKAEELEAKYGNPNSRSTDDTVTTGRDGHTMTYDEYISTLRGMFFQQGDFHYTTYGGSRGGKTTFEYERRQREAERIAEELRRNQWKWNEEYYDEHGNPKPQKEGRRWRPGRQRKGPDVDDIYEEAYKYAKDEDEDAGYDDWLRGSYDDE